MNNVDLFFRICEEIGTAAFAVSGSLMAVNKQMDLFGVIFLAGVTALGGGTLRDMLLGNLPPRMFSSYYYLAIAALCAVLVFVLAVIFKEKFVRSEIMIENINNIFDAVGLGVFAVSGARICVESGFGDNLFMVTFLGMTTAVGGGMIRDILIQETPFVLKKHIYAVAAILGAFLYGFLFSWGFSSRAAYAIGFSFTVGLRILATVYHWNLPKAL